MTDAQRRYIREYYREYRERNRAKVNARQKLANRMRRDPLRAGMIEGVKARYRADFPPIDGVIMDDNRTRLEIYYNRDGKRFVTERWFETSEDRKIHYTAICDLMKEG